jgi:ribulose-phosphate 3-epimerase
MIIPAILEKDALGFHDRVTAVLSLPAVKRVQVDFADGQFVENSTYPIDEFELLPPQIHWEAHLMVNRPYNFIDYHSKGFNTIIFHYEAFPDDQLRQGVIANIKALGMEVGMAINPETSVEVVRPFADSLDRITLLSVIPGKQGGQFIPESFNRIKQIREFFPHGILEVDGGIKIDTVKTLMEAGASDLAVGSGLFLADDVGERYQLLVEESK